MQRLAIHLSIALTIAMLASPVRAKDSAAVGEQVQSEKNAVSTEKPANKAASAKQSSKQASEEKAPVRKAPEKKPKPKKIRFAHFVLEGSIPESPGEMGPFGERETDLRKTIGRFARAAKDDSIAGIVLDLRGPAVGRGTVDEIRSAIHAFRKSGKKIYAQLEIASTQDYLIAASCDEVVMPESGFLLLPGVRLEPLFYKGLLTNLGIKAEFLHMGEAKGAGETFTRKKWSDPVRKNLDSLAGDLYEQMIETIALDRPVTEKKVRDSIDLALLTASQAQDAGLIDRIAYPDELRGHLAEETKADKLVYVENYGKKNVDTDFSGPAGFFKLMQAITGGKPTTGRRAGKKIAVVYAVGPIMTGESESGLFSESSVGSTTVVKALADANADEAVAAIVLRVNSPGGSAVASDLIWRKIREIEKPVVASMGDIAASGGYYISMGADKIYAEPAGITGSIGVVTGKFAMKGMFNKVGLSTDLITRGENSGIFTGTRKWNANERAAMMRMMEDTYAQFTSKAAAGRDMPLDQLKQLAGGKVYTGRQAVANGLIDATGTLNDAIASAKQLAGLTEEDKVRVETLPQAQEVL